VEKPSPVISLQLLSVFCIFYHSVSRVMIVTAMSASKYHINIHLHITLTKYTCTIECLPIFHVLKLKKKTL